MVQVTKGNAPPMMMTTLPVSLTNVSMPTVRTRCDAFHATQTQDNVQTARTQMATAR